MMCPVQIKNMVVKKAEWSPVINQISKVIAVKHYCTLVGPFNFSLQPPVIFACVFSEQWTHWSRPAVWNVLSNSAQCRRRRLSVICVAENKRQHFVHTVFALLHV